MKIFKDFPPPPQEWKYKTGTNTPPLFYRSLNVFKEGTHFCSWTHEETLETTCSLSLWSLSPFFLDSWSDVLSCSFSSLASWHLCWASARPRWIRSIWSQKINIVQPWLYGHQSSGYLYYLAMISQCMWSFFPFISTKQLAQNKLNVAKFLFHFI